MRVITVKGAGHRSGENEGGVLIIAGFVEGKTTREEEITYNNDAAEIFDLFYHVLPGGTFDALVERFKKYTEK
jgi:hypothetical protein